MDNHLDININDLHKLVYLVLKRCFREKHLGLIFRVLGRGKLNTISFTQAVGKQNRIWDNINLVPILLISIFSKYYSSRSIFEISDGKVNESNSADGRGLVHLEYREDLIYKLFVGSFHHYVLIPN